MNSLARLERTRPSATLPLPRLVTGEAERDEPTQEAPWTLLVAALSFSAGHGVVLGVALQDVVRAHGLRDLAGPSTSLPIAWFVLALPLLVGVLGLRRLRPSGRVVRWLTRGILTCTALAYAMHLFAIARA